MISHYAISHIVKQFLTDAGWHINSPDISPTTINFINISTYKSPVTLATLYIPINIINRLKLVIYHIPADPGSERATQYLFDLTNPNCFDEIHQLLLKAAHEQYKFSLNQQE